MVKLKTKQIRSLIMPPPPPPQIRRLINTSHLEAYKSQMPCFFSLSSFVIDVLNIV